MFTVLVVINVVILDQRTVDAQEGFMFNEAMPGRPSFGVHEEEEESKPFKDRILEFGNLWLAILLGILVLILLFLIWLQCYASMNHPRPVSFKTDPAVYAKNLLLTQSLISGGSNASMMAKTKRKGSFQENRPLECRVWGKDVVMNHTVTHFKR